MSRNPSAQTEGKTSHRPDNPYVRLANVLSLREEATKLYLRTSCNQKLAVDSSNSKEAVGYHALYKHHQKNLFLLSTKPKAKRLKRPHPPYFPYFPYTKQSMLFL